MQVAQPFPRPGRLVEHAHRELSIAANGTREHLRALGETRRLPRPWDPPSCTHPDLLPELWVWPDDVVTLLNHEYIWDTHDFIPSCWPDHPTSSTTWRSSPTNDGAPGWPIPATPSKTGTDTSFPHSSST